MAAVSRLEKHVDWIMKELAAGKNYTQVALDLSENGVQTSRVNLVKWLKLRKIRIERRIAQATPLINAPVLSPQPISTIEKPEILEESKNAKVEVFRTTIPNLMPSRSLRKPEKKVSDAYFDDLIQKIDQESESPFGRINK